MVAIRTQNACRVGEHRPLYKPCAFPMVRKNAVWLTCGGDVVPFLNVVVDEAIEKKSVFSFHANYWLLVAMLAVLKD